MTQVTSNDVTERIRDWVSRLNGLYSKLDTWLEAIPHDRVEREMLPQVIEPFMRQFNVPPQDVPTYTVFKGRNRVAFVPSALWVAGSNGRVNVTTNARQHVLVDRGNADHGSNWQLVVEDFDRPLVPFSKSQLVRLLLESE